MARILVADDEPKLGTLLAEALELDGHEAIRVGGGREALARLEAGAFDVVVTDLRMPGVDGLAVLRAARALHAPPEVVLMTAHATAESAVAAMKAGAADYVVKPFAVDELRMRVRRLASQREAERKSDRLLARLTPDLVAESASMREALAAAQRVAATDATVLLLGESGTGKTQLARYIHYRSPRAAAALAEVHSAALPETLLESELFGHEKGAFTGATERKAGHLASADGGTLFLDEIGEVTPAMQVKLLRFLQEREYVAVGSTEVRRVDVRVIAATNLDLGEAVQEGRFREDLFYRLERVRHPPPTAPRPARRHRAAGLPVPGRARPSPREAHAAGPGPAPGAVLAGQRARAGEHAGAVADPGGGSGDPARGPRQARSAPRSIARVRRAGGGVRFGRLRARAHPGSPGAGGREQDRRRPAPGDHPAPALLAARGAGGRDEGGGAGEG